MEKGKTEKKAWKKKLDAYVALRQRLCWLAAAGVAVAGEALILLFLPPRHSTYFTLALALLLMLGYQWAARAPWRALTAAYEAGKAAEKRQAALDFVLRLEKALPAMKKKEMAYQLTVIRALLLHGLGRKEEALSLLRGFTQIWDAAQREQLEDLIRQMEGKSVPSPDREEEA